MSTQQGNPYPFSSNPVLTRQVEFQLVRAGFSAQAARQLVMGEPVTSFADRLLFSQKNQDIEVENDETHWVGNGVFPRNGATPGVSGATAAGRCVERLRKAGVSPRGVRECLAGLPIKSSADRSAIAALIHRLFGQAP
jgi:hypothetical protein